MLSTVIRRDEFYRTLRRNSEDVAVARAARIKELQEQDQMGIDRERIESRGGVTAGP